MGPDDEELRDYMTAAEHDELMADWNDAMEEE